jgi:hypothetical protein
VETDHALDSLFGHIFYGKPVSTFPENALAPPHKGEGNAIAFVTKKFVLATHPRPSLCSEWRAANGELKEAFFPTRYFAIRQFFLDPTTTKGKRNAGRRMSQCSASADAARAYRSALA